jgi:hypothetical protein
MGAMEDQQRKNAASQLASGKITKSQYDSAISKIGSGSSVASKPASSGGGGSGVSSGGSYNPSLRVTNLYSDAAWDPKTRTISAGGRTLYEGQDFEINQADNRAYYIPAGSGPSRVEQPNIQLTPDPGILAPQEEIFDPTDYINELKEAQRASRIASLDKARANALSALDTEKANVAPAYYDKRNQAAAASDVGAMNFAQYMAARGIKGPAGAMPEIYRQAGLQGQIGALDRQEAANLVAIENQRANINTGYESDVAAANADVEAQAMQNLINQWNANRQYQLQESQLTGDLNGDRTLAGQEFDWSKSSSNPAVQAQILANKAAELENAAREIENSYLPDTLKLQVQRLEQQVKAGALDYDTALAQINQIKAQTANYSRSGSSGGGGSSTRTLTPGQQLTAQQNNINNLQNLRERATAIAENDPRLNNPTDTTANTLQQLENAHYELLKFVYDARNQGKSEEQIAAYIRSKGLSPLTYM